MSQQSTQIQFENPILREADTLSQLLYNKPYAELDEKRQETMLRSAHALPREKCTDGQPGYCFQCGDKLMREDSAECRKCHDPIDSVGQYYFNGRWEPII
jgi:hypothetical protein